MERGGGVIEMLEDMLDKSKAARWAGESAGRVLTWGGVRSANTPKTSPGALSAVVFPRLKVVQQPAVVLRTSESSSTWTLESREDFSSFSQALD